VFTILLRPSRRLVGTTVRLTAVKDEPQLR
jgi:hypothetical protein